MTLHVWNLVSVLWVSWGCLVGVWMVPGGCLVGVRWVSVRCLEGVLRPKSTSVEQSMSWNRFQMSQQQEGRRRNNPHLASARRNDPDPACLKFVDCPVSFLRVSCRCLDGVRCFLVGVWKVSVGYLKSVWMLSGGCLKGVWRVSMGCVECLNLSQGQVRTLSSQDRSNQDRSNQDRPSQDRSSQVRSS